MVSVVDHWRLDVVGLVRLTLLDGLVVLLNAPVLDVEVEAQTVTDDALHFGSHLRLLVWHLDHVICAI